MNDSPSHSSETISSLLAEERVFPPSEQFTANANFKDPEIYEDASQDFVAYWSNWSKQLEWFTPWTEALEWNPPHAKWFFDGELNACHNCVDRHANGPNANKTALLWEGEPGDTRTLSYQQLKAEVSRAANALKTLGVKKGDIVCIYMPMVPELAIAMLACARIGAVHSVVFGGFSAEALKERINDASAVLVITADGGWRRGRELLLKTVVDEALAECRSVSNVLVFNRLGKTQQEVNWVEGRDHWWSELVDAASENCPCEPMPAESMLFTLYTSGSTGKPKGIVHTTGGYMTGVHATFQMVFDHKDSDIFWCTADCGWITGHSYVVYGPLSNGTTVLMYEGAPDTPNKDRFWRIVEKHKVTVLYTAPTAIRTFMKWGDEYPSQCDLSSLRLLGTVGEPINPEAWVWYWKVIGGGNCPVVDTWWQTETGHILISPLPGITACKPGSATRALPGITAELFNDAGEKLQGAHGGYLVLTKPWPGMLRGIFGDPERYVQQYWSRYDGIYFTGDGAKRDNDGYLWLLGRVDDVMNVSGHRISTMEVESALVDHPAVAEAAVIGKSHEIKGQAISAFVLIRSGYDGDALVEEIRAHVVRLIGAVARPDDLFVCGDLPKTRSGKIMRRLLRDIAEGRALGDTTTLSDPTVVSNLRNQYEHLEG